MRPASVVDSGGVSRAESPAVELRTLCNSVSVSVCHVSVWRIRYRVQRDGVVLKKKGMRAGMSSTGWNPNGPASSECIENG
jgi:hypothetical protein